MAIEFLNDVDILGSLKAGTIKDGNDSIGATGTFLKSVGSSGLVWGDAVNYTAGSDNLVLSAPIATSIGGDGYGPWILIAPDNPGVTNGPVKRIRLSSVSLSKLTTTLEVNKRINTSRSSPSNNNLTDACFNASNSYQGGGIQYNYSSNVSSTSGARHFGFSINGTVVGSISQGMGNVAYNTTASDERLKKNIEPWAEDVLDKFDKIQPKKFNYLTDTEDQDKTKGYIAQEMVESFPEAYPLDYSGENYYNYNPSGMVVYLTKAIKELIDKNKELENRIQELENQ